MARCFGETGGEAEVVEFAFIAPGFDCGFAGVETVREVLAIGTVLVISLVSSRVLEREEETYGVNEVASLSPFLGILCQCFVPYE